MGVSQLGINLGDWVIIFRTHTQRLHKTMLEDSHKKNSPQTSRTNWLVRNKWIWPVVYISIIMATFGFRNTLVGLVKSFLIPIP